ANPVPKIAHPDWLRRRVTAQNDKLKQKKVSDLFQKLDPSKLTDVTNLSHPTTHAAKPLVPAKRKELHSSSQKENKPPEEVGTVAQEAPSTDDYPSWLAFQKKKWLIQRQSRARRRKVLGDRGLTTSLASGLGDYFRGQAESIFTQKWEIIELRTT